MEKSVYDYVWLQLEKWPIETKAALMVDLQDDIEAEICETKKLDTQILGLAAKQLSKWVEKE